MKPQHDISNWIVRKHPANPTVAQLVGTLGEPHHTLGEIPNVYTSGILKIHVEQNKVETHNTIYRLKGLGSCLLPDGMAAKLKVISGGRCESAR